MSFFQQLGAKLLNNKFPMIGVDISADSIEFLQLQPGIGKPKIKANYRLDLEPGLIVNGRIRDLSKLAILLQAAFKKEKFSNNNCLLSLPDKESFFLTLESESLETEIYSLAQENLPVDLANYYYDFMMLNEKKAFFGAAPKEIIKQYLDVFALAKLNLQVVDFESACLARALVSKKETVEPAFIIDLGAKSTDVVLIDQSGFQDQINFAIGGYFFTQKIAESLKKDFDQAEKIKQQNGVKIEGLDGEALITEMYAPLFVEINKMSVEYKVKKGQAVKKIILAGGASKLKGLADIFNKNLSEFEINPGDLGAKIDFDDKIKAVDQILYANVTGLALRGLNNNSLDKGLNLLKILSA